MAELGPRAVGIKLARRARDVLRHAAERRLDQRRPTLLRPCPGERLRRRVRHQPLPAAGLDDILAHRFDILGSGPVDWTREITTDAAADWLADEVDAANLPASRELWRMISPGYRPIDWPRDAKSAYRWSARQWSRDLAAPAAGADIKVPWELARLQHLPRLAAAGWDGARELRDQVLDFLATNPPRFGVNWRCPMDVAIRAANIALAADLLEASGTAIDGAFAAVLAAALRMHGRFVFENLEWQPDYRGNHYLADIVGLLFCAAYLPSSEETQRWLDFGAGELISEVESQFLADGGSHEGSTCYHRLSAELAAFGTALLLAEGVNVPASHGDRLAGMAGFLRDMTGPAGMVQIGDNDSGRLFKLSARGDLDPGDTIEALDALRGTVTGCSGRLAADLAAGKHIAGGTSRPKAPSTVVSVPTRDVRRRRFAARCGGPPPTVAWYPQFGVVVFRADWLFLTVRCRAHRSHGPDAHAHNDQLSIELWLDGAPVIRDPGSYLYTSAPDWRDRYRSVRAHDAPWLEGLGEPAPFTDIFGLGPGVMADCLHAGPDGFLGRLRPPAPPIHRAVLIERDAVEIVDWVEGDAAPRWIAPDPGISFSPSYGLREL